MFSADREINGTMFRSGGKVYPMVSDGKVIPIPVGNNRQGPPSRGNFTAWRKPKPEACFTQVEEAESMSEYEYEEMDWRMDESANF